MELIRQPIFLLLVTASAVFIVLLACIPYFGFGDDPKLVKDSVLAVMLLSGLLGAVLSASSSVAREIRTGTAFLRTSDSSSPVTAGLTAIAVAEAGQLAGGISISGIASFRQVLRPCVAIVAGAAIGGFVLLLFPDLFPAEWLWFSDPYGDHPPYSRVRFSVEPGDTNILYGSFLDVFATAVHRRKSQQFGDLKLRR